MATHKLTRRGFLKAAGLGAAAVTVSGVVSRLLGPAGSAEPAGSSGNKPNFIIFFTDDQGYADLGCFGSGTAPGSLPAVSTPNINNMAAQGVKFTDFYVSASVCSASRASLLTGCYCERVGVTGALYPGEAGLDPREITIANLLKAEGYATTCIGKWHLGDLAGRLPTDQGFDSYFGIPYSNDLYPGGPNPPYVSGGSWHSQWPALPL
ncbi:MAG: sulfatase-like hydrolase/transferase, partial [Planctomycetota bacterium]